MQDVITNGSGHGLDALATNSDVVLIVEVKANIAKMNAEQLKGPNSYADYQLKAQEEGLEGSGRYKAAMAEDGAEEIWQKNKDIINDERPNIGKEMRVDVASDGTGCYKSKPTTSDKKANKKAPDRVVGKCKLGPKGIQIKDWKDKLNKP